MGVSTSAGVLFVFAGLYRSCCKIGYCNGRTVHHIKVTFIVVLLISYTMCGKYFLAFQNVLRRYWCGIKVTVLLAIEIVAGTLFWKKIGSCIKCWSIEGFTIEAPLPGSAADLTPAQILTGHCKLCVKSRMPHYNAIFQKEPPNFSRYRCRSNISVVLIWHRHRSCIKCWSIEGFTIEAPLPGSAADLTPAQILTGHCKLCVKSRMPHYNAIFQKEPPNFSRCRSRSNISVVLYFALERANYEWTMKELTMSDSDLNLLCCLT